MRLSILGGSSPFILELFLALERAGGHALTEVVLYGRNVAALDLIARFARRRLDIAVNWTCELDEACESFDIVIHQIRYGGLEGRDSDERHALAAGSIPDESLGAAAITSMQRMRAPLEAVCAQLVARSPAAHIINMTNPLGLSTSLMKVSGIPNPVGICELPQVTAEAAARICRLPADAMTWDYAGLNHRGFLYNVKFGGEDLLPRIAESGIAKPFGGLSGNELLELGALPTKYFQLFITGEPISAPGRAASLSRLRDQIFAELRADPGSVPPSLASRDQPWWECSVVPLLQDLSSNEEGRHILNWVGADGLTREGWASVAGGRIVPIQAPPTPPRAAAWIAAFESHERAALAHALKPTEATLAAVDAADPLGVNFRGRPLWRHRRV